MACPLPREKTFINDSPFFRRRSIARFSIRSHLLKHRSLSFHSLELWPGPPSQLTRQMEKDLSNTLYKRLLEAEALEKKKKKEVAKEKENHAKEEEERAKALYNQLLKAEALEKKIKKEIKKEKK
jgi:hypothetical protein